MGMQDCIELKVSPDRPNIRLASKKVSSDSSNTFSWLCEELKTKGPTTDKVMVYCNTISECTQLYLDFKAVLGKSFCYPQGANDVCYNRLVDMYHSATDDDVKEHITNSLKNPESTLRVAIATSALGMGVDLKDINMVIHYGPPREMEDYMQALGRAGRDGADSHSLILYHGKQLVWVSDQMRNYVNTVTCRRVKLLYLFDEEQVKPLSPGHRCCDVCAKFCTCDETSCNGRPSMMETHADKVPAHRERSVSNAQKQELKTRLQDLVFDIAEPALPSTVSLYSCTTSDSSNQELISEVVHNISILFSLEDIFLKTQVSTMAQANQILDVISDVFHDMA